MTPDTDGAVIDIQLTAISEHARNLYRDGYHRDAVRHESQRLLNRLRDLADLPELDGQALVQRAFAEQAPILVLNQRTTAIERNEQAGLRYLTLGVTCALRNVLTHDVERDVSAQDGAIWLGLIGWLHQQLDSTERIDSAADEANGQVDAP